MAQKKKKYNRKNSANTEDRFLLTEGSNNFSGKLRKQLKSAFAFRIKIYEQHFR